MRRFLPLLLAFAPCLAAAQWSVIQAPHFRVVTDAGDKRGRQVALHLEQMRQGFSQILLRPNLNEMAPLRTLVFHDQSGLTQVAPSGIAPGSGFFLAQPDENFLALDASSPDGWPQAMREYGRMLLDSNYPATPLWFDTGLPEFFASIQVSKDELLFGVVPATLSFSGHWIPAARLLAITRDDAEFKNASTRMQFTGEAWLMLDWLMHDRMPQAGQYFALLQQGTPPEDAVKQAFGITAAELDVQLHAAQKLPPLHYQLPQIEPENFGYDRIKPFEGEAAVAEMQAHEPEHRAQALATLEQVVAKQPEYSPAQAALGYAQLSAKEPAAAGKHLLRAIALGPASGTVYYWATKLMMASNERDSGALQQMNDWLQEGLKIDPQFAVGWAARATALEWATNWAEAATALRNAARLSPRHGQYQLELALCIAHQRKWDEALALLQSLESNPDANTAAAARRQFATVTEWKKHPILEETQQQPPQPDELAAWKAKHPERAAELDKMQNEQSEDNDIKPEARPDTRPVLFMKGVLRSVRCGSSKPDSAEAMLELSSGGKLFHLHIADTSRLTLIGAESFDCGWKDVKAAVNYRESAHGSGDVVSLELQ